MTSRFESATSIGGLVNADRQEFQYAVVSRRSPFPRPIQTRDYFTFGIDHKMGNTGSNRVPYDDCLASDEGHTRVHIYSHTYTHTHTHSHKHTHTHHTHALYTSHTHTNGNFVYTSHTYTSCAHIMHAPCVHIIHTPFI